MELEVEHENLKKAYEELLKQHVEMRKRQIEPVIYLFEILFPQPVHQLKYLPHLT